MITGHIIRQHLNLCDSHVVADTIDYLEAKFIFKTDDWDGLDKWAHFANDGGTVYDIRLTEDRIWKEDHLNLSAGMWKVYLHGNEFRDGKVIQRITTDEAVLYVNPTGMLDGDPFPGVPPSAGEQAFAAVQSAKNSAERAEIAADRAEQVAVANGYMEFELDNEDGILYLYRTDNIVDEIDFELDEETGELEVIIE